MVLTTFEHFLDVVQRDYDCRILTRPNRRKCLIRGVGNLRRYIDLPDYPPELRLQPEVIRGWCVRLGIPPDRFIPPDGYGTDN